MDADSNPEVSVVVATHNRAALLGRLIGALERQDMPGRFEVIIVDDGSTDDTWSVLEHHAASSGLDLSPVRLERNIGPAGARNAGWRTARAPVVAFTDDDCTPQIGWLRALAGAMNQADIGQGRTMPDPNQPTTGWFSWAPQTTGESAFYETCNIAYRRTTLAGVGGFDARYHARTRLGRSARYVAPMWGEDTDLALRALDLGARATFVSDAIVWHDMKPGRLRDRLADLPRRRGLVLAVKRHPLLRAQLEHRWFTQRAHAVLLGGVAALGAAAWRPTNLVPWTVAAILMSAWARMRGTYYPMRAWPRVLPQWIVVDLGEIIVLGSASLRYRTVLL